MYLPPPLVCSPGGAGVLIFYFFIIAWTRIYEKEVGLLPGRVEEDGLSGSVSHVVTEEDDVVWRGGSKSFFKTFV